MINHRLPANIYQYKATISGIPLTDLLVIIVSLCISLVLARVSLVVSAILAPVALLIFFTIRKDRNGRQIFIRLVTPKGRKVVRVEALFQEYNGHIFVASGQSLSLIFRMHGLNILSMREVQQNDILSGIADTLNHIRGDVDFFSIQHGGKSGVGKKQPHRTYMRITTRSEKRDFAEKAHNIIAATSELSQYFIKSGFAMLEVESREVLSEILMHLAGQIKWSNPNGKDKDSLSEKIHYRQYVNYAITDKFTTDIVVINSSYSSGPFYQTFLEGMNIPFDIIFSIRNINGKNTLQYINRLLAERKTEYRFSRGMSGETEYLKRQISDLEKMKQSHEKGGNSVYDVTMLIRIFANHPAILNERVHRIRNSLELLGFNTTHDSSGILRKLRNFSLNINKPKYLMDTPNIAAILPLFRDEINQKGGIILGIDDLSEKVVDYNPFAQNSYNSLIIGETGSGKSYFTKMFLMRSIQSGICGKITIFDPLDEYDCKLFGANCSEYTIGSYVNSFISNQQEFNVTEEDSNDSRHIRIIKPQYDELESDKIIEEMLTVLNRKMNANKSGNMLIVIDECHIILRNNSNAKLLGTMIRHSRHYNTSIMNISQNTDDFLTRISSNIAYNSNRIFIFRTRNINDSHRKILKIDGFDVPAPENLMGGNSHQYSECIVSDGTYCRTIRVITSNDEELILKKSV